MKRDVALLGALLGLVTKLAYGTRDLYDLGHFDESYYRTAGRAWYGQGIALQADWGPLYSLWLSIWDRSFGAPDSHYGNLIFLLFASALVTYAVARRLTSAYGAFGAAVAVAVLQINLPTGSKIYLFSVIFALAFLALGSLFRRPGAALSVMASGLAAALFVRPELVVSWALLQCLLAHTLRHEWRRKKISDVRAAFLLVLPAGIFAAFAGAWGNPLAGSQFPTSLAQQWVRRWCEWFEPAFPWAHDAFAKWQALFPSAPNVAQAMAQHPQWFLRFFWENFLALPGVLYRATFSLQAWGHVGQIGVTSAGHLAAIAVAISLVAGRAQIRPFLNSLRATVGPLAVGLLALALAPLAWGVAVFPEPHFLAAPVVGFWIFAGAWFAFVLPRQEFAPVPWLPTAALGGLAFLFVPFTKSPWDPTLPPDKPNLRIYRALARLPLRPELTKIYMADDFQGYAAYQTSRVIRIPPWERSAPLDRFLRVRNVGILVTHGQQPFLPQSDWNDLQQNPVKWGYVPFPVYRQSPIYVRQDLLKASPPLSEAYPVDEVMAAP